MASEFLEHLSSGLKALCISLFVQVDIKNEAVLLPIYGMVVPFHITTIKNVTSSQVWVMWYMQGCPVEATDHGGVH